MKFERTEVMNFEGALRGMRNPLNSWNKSDSEFTGTVPAAGGWFHIPHVEIGENDMKLAKRLIAGGPEHRKFLRQIFVSVDITAPLYWWKEFDTYKVGTTANSTSTMHKLASTPITLSCFELDDHNPDLNIWDKGDGYPFGDDVSTIIGICERLRQMYLETNDKQYWKELVRWLPEGWLQTRTVTMNYENLATMYHQRKNHKLTEWSESFINWIKTLPYAQEFIIQEESDD